MAEKYVLMDLKDESSKELATVLSSFTAKKILDLLSEKNKLSETDISKELSVPISTVHYNLSVLQKAKLVEAKEFHYSKKGREINHYSLANKLIIIAPSKVDDLMKDRIKNLFLSIVFGVFAISTGVFSYFKSVFSNSNALDLVVQETTRDVPLLVKGASGILGAEATPMMVDAYEGVSNSLPFWSFQNPVILIILGAIIGICAVFCIIFLVRFIKAKSASKS